MAKLPQQFSRIEQSVRLELPDALNAPLTWEPVLILDLDPARGDFVRIYRVIRPRGPASGSGDTGNVVGELVGSLPVH